MPPFPSTKSSVARISQLVADLKSQKRANSLVVHTGFPTSLIDLAVKNRRRFRKPDPKKPGRPETSRPPPPEKPTSSDFTAVRAEPGHCVDEVAGSGPECSGSGSKSVLAAVLKMLAVVVVFASVEKLAVAVTVSAFALLFLENVGKRVVSFPDFLTRGIRVWVWFLRHPEPANAEVEGDSVVVEAECGSESDEIEVVETKGTEVGVCSCPKSDCVSEDKKRICSEMVENSTEKFVGSCEGNRSVKFKSKMKKLLSKKWRSFRKEGKIKRSTKESKAEATVKSQKDEGDGNRSLLLVKIELECVTEKEVDHADTFSEECSLAEVEDVKVTSEGKIIDGVGNSGHLILFLIALFGLVAGRLASLVLTMTWCFTLKFVATRGRLKVPLIKCSVPKS